MSEEDGVYQLSQDCPQTIFRMATHRGDLVITWRDNQIMIHGQVSTLQERAKLQGWATEHKLTIRGDLAGTSRITADPAVLRSALNALVNKEVGEAGWLVFAVSQRGKARVIRQRNVDVGEEAEIVKVPQTSGG